MIETAFVLLAAVFVIDWALWKLRRIK